MDHVDFSVLIRGRDVGSIARPRSQWEYVTIMSVAKSLSHLTTCPGQSITVMFVILAESHCQAIVHGVRDCGNRDAILLPQRESDWLSNL